MSSWHSKVRPPAAVTLSVPANEKEALVWVVVAGGWAVIEVSGESVSTVKARVAGVASVFPAVSVARTEIV